MSNLSIKLGAGTVDLTGTGDLGNLLNPGLNTVLQLAGDLANLGGARLADVPAGALQTGFSADREAKWTLNGVNLTFSFKPTASGSITITKSGELFSYRPGDDPSQTTSISVPAGQVYVSIAFKVGLSVAGGASFSSNGVGVSASVSNSDEFDVVNHKCFPEDTPVGTAVADAFRGFVLPFKAAGVDALNDNDYIDFDFIGNLALGFGVTYGLSGLLLGGRSGGEIDASFSNNPLGKIVFNAKPTFKAAADFSVKYSHQDAFRVIVGRRKSGGVNGASLYLFRQDKSALTTQFNAGITLSANASFNAGTNIDSVLNQAANTAVSKLPAEVQSVASMALSKGLQAAEGKIDGFVTTVNGKVNALLQKGNDQKVALQVMIERTTSGTALFQYQFDFTADPALAGFGLAIAGDYAAAITKPGVTLAPGSFVEHEFINRASLAFQFFGLWKYTSVTEYFQNAKVTYAGNGVFHIAAKTGVTEESGEVGHTGQCQVYFTAAASETAQTQSISDLDVQLTFVLTDNKNRKSAVQTANALESLNVPALSGDLQALSGVDLAQRVLQVTCTFPKTAYDKLTFDAFFKKDDPGNMPHPVDAANYKRFADAVSLTDRNAPALFKSYQNWAVYNTVKIDRDGAPIRPNRRHSGNIGGTGWPDTFPHLDSAGQAIAGCYFEAGRNFMNLCEDLKRLTPVIDAATTEALFNELLKTLNTIINQDVPVFFIKATLIALLRAMNATPVKIQSSGAAGDAPIDISFEAALQQVVSP